MTDAKRAVHAIEFNSDDRPAIDTSIHGAHLFTVDARLLGPLVLGPINHKVYASFAPKRYAFEIARREADKRGFTEASGKLINSTQRRGPDPATKARENDFRRRFATSNVESTRCTTTS